jgi:hypothetical protein
LKRQLSLPVSTMSQWWVSRSRSAVVILASPNTLGHSPKSRLVVMTIDALIESADQMEQQLGAGLGERQIAEFVEDDEVHAGEVVGKTALPAGARLGLEPVDQTDDVVETATGSTSDAGPGNGDRQVGLPGPGAADQHQVALLGKEASAGKILYQSLVDRRAVELEVRQVPRLREGRLLARGSLAEVS